VASGWARVAALAAPETCVQCTWSFFKPCNFLLPPPVTCNMCSAPVHHLCQIIWENKHSYEPPGCAKYCPLHHAHYQEMVTVGGGKRSSDKSSASLSMISAAAATVAARAAQHYNSCSIKGAGAAFIRSITLYFAVISRGIYIDPGTHPTSTSRGTPSSQYLWE
jgi:hypothetical protein